MIGRLLSVVMGLGRTVGGIAGGVLSPGILIPLIFGAATVGYLMFNAAKARAEYQRCQAEHSAYVADVERQAREASERARAREHKLQEDITTLRSIRDKENADAEARINTLSADLRTGDVRVRREVCEAGADHRVMPGPPRAGSPANAAAGIREHPAALAVGTGAQADSQVRYLQSLIRSYRAACNG